MTKIEKLNIRLKELFEKDEPLVITINGKWGIGKTFFWNSFVDTYLSEELEKKKPLSRTGKIWLNLKQILEDKFDKKDLLESLENKFKQEMEKRFGKSDNIAYISLFGKEKLEDIESDIVLQISKMTKIKKLLANSIGNIGYSGVKVSNLLSIVPKANFKNIVICIDDFERISNKLQPKEVLGLISTLKEQKQCKVVMIFNQEKLEDDDLKDYKEKVIDYELQFKPTVKESFDLVSSSLSCFKEFPIEYLSEYGISNIRVIKRVINALNDYSFIESVLEEYPKLKKTVAYSIIRAVVVNALCTPYDLDKLENYINSRLFNKDEKNKNKQYEEILYYFNEEISIFYDSSILKNIKNYIDNSIIEKEELTNIINKRIKYIKDETLRNAIIELYNKYKFNLNYTKEEYIKDSFSLLNKEPDSLIRIFGPNNFISLMNTFINLDKKNKETYTNFMTQRFKSFFEIEHTSKYIKKLNILGTIESIKEIDPELKELIENKERELKSEKTKTKEEILTLIKTPREKNGWGDEPKLLALVNIETYKNYMIESQVFLNEIISFLQWLDAPNNHIKSFDAAIKVMKDALLELREESKYTEKINTLIEDYNISIDENPEKQE